MRLARRLGDGGFGLVRFFLVSRNKNGPVSEAIFSYVASFTSIADSHASYDAMARAVDNNLPLDITAAAIGVWATIVAVGASIIVAVRATIVAAA
jgi:hypothetical protein